MEVVADVDFNIMTMLMTVLNIALLGVGIYVIYLVIKALRIYIKKNS